MILYFTNGVENFSQFFHCLVICCIHFVRNNGDVTICYNPVVSIVSFLKVLKIACHPVVISTLWICPFLKLPYPSSFTLGCSLNTLYCIAGNIRKVYIVVCPVCWRVGNQLLQKLWQILLNCRKVGIRIVCVNGNSNGRDAPQTPFCSSSKCLPCSTIFPSSINSTRLPTSLAKPIS